ncbi:hypothetical protein U3516DRAFT_775963 [Neocallimastix sp. 'constans']
MNQRIAYEMLYLTIVGILEEASILSKKCFTAGKCYTVCTNYEPKEREELTLRVKDRIHIIEVYSDGRAYGKNVITEQTGIFPLSYLKNEVKNKRMKDLKVAFRQVESCDCQ